jgi:hypothetical protein
MNMAGVTALLERRCGAWNVRAAFHIGVDSKLSNSRCGEDQPEGHGHDDQKCRDAAVKRLVSRAGTRVSRIRIRQLTVLSMIGVNRAVAFNRDWQREDRLNAGFEKLFKLNTTALILDEALSTRRAQLSPAEPPPERPIQTTAVGPCIGHPGHG